MSDLDPNVSRIYREASSEVPPAALDAAILAAARRQVARPQRRVRSSWLRWMAPASAVATLVVAVSLSFLVEREQASRDTREGPIAPQPQRAPPARTTESSKPKATDNAAPATEAKTESPAAAKTEAAAAAIEKKDKPAAAAPAQAPVPAAPAATVPAPARAQAAAPTAEAFPAESSAKAAGISAKQKESSAGATESSTKAVESSAEAAESRLSAAKRAAESNAAGDAALRSPGAAAPAASAPASKVAPLQPIQRSAEAWLEDISRLRRAGREQEAAEQLAEFRKAYPAYPIPENLLK